MKKNIEFVTGNYGLRAVIKTLWQESYLDQLINKNIKELELNIGKGWRNNGNVDFLKFLPNLKSIIILDQPLKSIEPVHYLTELQSINISAYCKTPVNFTSFPNLINCSFEWIKGSKSLFECKNLRTLGINNFDEKDSSLFSQLVNLEKLTVLNSKTENLEGVFYLKNLTYLSIANLKRLTSLQGIEKLYNIEDLEIQTCKGIKNISEVFKLKTLKRFFVVDSGDIDSIKGIEELTELTTFLFYESTNIVDGDLSPLFKLKRLSKVSFQNRKHYSNKREDFGKLYFQ